KVEFVASFIPTGPRIPHLDLGVVLLETTDQINHLRVPDIGAVLLKSQAHDENSTADHRKPTFHHQSRNAIRHVRSHAVINPAASEDHLGMVADLLSAMREIIRVDTDAVPPDEAGLKR